MTPIPRLAPLATLIFVALFGPDAYSQLPAAAPPAETSAAPAATTTAPMRATPPADYVLQPGDFIRVQVFQESDLDRELPVSAGGTITGLPLIGSISVAGLTVPQLEAEIARRYDADYLVNPQITITVLRYVERRVNVLGAVNGPGIVVFPPAEPLSLIDAIARAGDFNRLADRRRVRLTRTGPDGATKSHVIDADELRSGSAPRAWWLERDDIIFVPERRL